MPNRSRRANLSRERGRAIRAALCLLGVVALLGGQRAVAQNQPPVVSSVAASQRTDGSRLVDIYYDLADAEGDACTISVLASDDAGATWNVPITAVSGDVGREIAPAPGRHIVWDSAADLPWVVGGQYEVQVCGNDMVLVPSGTFEMGDSFAEGNPSERPVHTVYLNSYTIDRCEITNARYAAALNWAWSQGGLITVNSGMVNKAVSGEQYCDTTTSSSQSQITWNGSVFGVVAGSANRPVVRVSWYGAVAYCNWRSAMGGRPLCYDLADWTCDFDVAGYRLPTEAEWEKAAGWDPNEQRHYRFGEHTDGCGVHCLDARRANYGGSGDPFEASALPWTTPVGFYNGALHYKADFNWPNSQETYQTQDARSYYGCYDMSGNVWEWCYDWYGAGYYEAYPIDEWPPNPTGPSSGALRVFRGGSWNEPPSDCRSAARGSDGPPASLTASLGFRCAASPFGIACSDSPPFPIDNLGNWCLGDMDCSGGTPTFDDIKYFSAAIGSESGWWAYYKSRHPQQEDPPCPWLAGDFVPPPGVEFSDIKPFAASIGQPCTQYVPRGACCLPSGGCIGNVTQADCGLLDGWWAGPLTACGDPNVCTGACCSSPAGCTYVSWPECDGDWLGPGSDCDPYPCGACCYDDGTCVVSGLTDCTADGGSWQGPGTSCEPNLCPQPGACCAWDGTCTVTLEAACTGVWQGAGTDCDPNPCPQPGACCHVDGTCIFMQQADCLLVPQAVWLGPGIECDPNPCFPAGACCFPDAHCEFLVQTVCEAGGGRWAGSETTCEPNTCGACCRYDGGCWGVMTESACTEHWGGVGTTCDQCPLAGACCLNGSCAEFIEEACASIGGAFQGAGTTCSVGDCQACCFEDGTCADMTQALCIAAGGTPQGAGATCETDPCGACCDYYGACEVVPENVCLAAGGQWLGAGIGCVPDPCYGACCKIISPYSCVLLLSAEDCALAGANWQWAGYGTDCWDDPGDPDTIAEECE